jgi:mRNA interferase RelE/StbE
MNIIIKQSFAKDCEWVEKETLLKVKKFLELIEKMSILTLFQMFDIKKLKGYNNYYRIRMGNYRIGLKIEWKEIQVIRIKQRKDIYKVFPG